MTLKISLNTSVIYSSKGGRGAATGVGEGGVGDSLDVADPDHEESSLGLTSVASPTGYSRTRRFLALECCIKAT